MMTITEVVEELQEAVRQLMKENKEKTLKIQQIEKRLRNLELPRN